MALASKIGLSQIFQSLSQVFQSLTQNSGHTLDLVFLLEQWQSDLKLEEVSFLSWLDHALISM